MKLILNNCDLSIRRFDSSILQPKEIAKYVFSSEGNFIGTETSGVCYKYDVTNIDKVLINYGVVSYSVTTSARTEYAALRDGLVQSCEDHKTVNANAEETKYVDVSTCDELYINVWAGTETLPKVKSVDGKEYSILDGEVENGYYNKSGEFKSLTNFVCKRYNVSTYSSIDAIGAGIVANGVPFVVLLDASGSVLSNQGYDDAAEGRTTTRSTIDVSGATTMIVNSLALITPTALVASIEANKQQPL